MKTGCGFVTLIELLILICLTGLLAAIGIPAYRDYQIREGMYKEMYRVQDKTLNGAGPCLSVWASDSLNGIFKCKIIPASRGDLANTILYYYASPTLVHGTVVVSSEPDWVYESNNPDQPRPVRWKRRFIKTDTSDR